MADQMLRSSILSLTFTPHSFFSGRRIFLPNFSRSPSDHFSYPLSSAGRFSTLRSTSSPSNAECIYVDEKEEIGVSEFIEVGYISSVHGIKGELRVKPNTGFPELRFCKPGRRWVRARILGKERVSEMELLKGRSHPGQKCWIISFEGIDTVDKAKQIVGSTVLVRDGDRPELEEEEFYTHDLVGMVVIQKETGTLVGTVANVLNFGANDLLHVKRHSSYPNKEKLDHSDSYLSEIDTSGQCLWIPFVKEIVPEIDMERREMIITPPKGLLELNLHRDTRSKKERRQMEWKQRKKLQQRITAAKKKLYELGQSHLFDGLSIGEKGQRAMLARQIVDINLSLFQHAVQSIEASSVRLSLFDFVGANSDLLLKNVLKIPHKHLLDCVYPEKYDELFKEGLQLLNNSKAAIILVINDDRSLGMASNEFLLDKLQQLLLDYQRFLKSGEKCIEIPLIMLTSTGQTKSSQQFFLDNDYFGFNAEKVLFIEETKLPIVSKSGDSNKILLKSPWEILEAPSGSGGTFAALSSQKALDFLREMGVEYVQIRSVAGGRGGVGIPIFYGWARSCRAEMAVKVCGNKEEEEEDGFDVIFSMGKLRSICEQIEGLSFQAVAEQHRHSEKVGGEWVEIEPASFNSYRLHCHIHAAFSLCAAGEVCVMQEVLE